MEPRETSWTLIDAARQGDEVARERFAREYDSAVRAYLGARWARGRLAAETDDAVQEVWLDCLRESGALSRADPTRPFRPFLLGVARTVALRFERRQARAAATEGEGDSPEARDTRASQAFDRELARRVMSEASELQRARAAAAGGLRRQRVELLELHFQHGLSVPQVAERWGIDASRVHHMYADAREDFREALREVVSRRNGTPLGDAALERECDWMLEVLRNSRD